MKYNRRRRKYEQRMGFRDHARGDHELLKRNLILNNRPCYALIAALRAEDDKAFERYIRSILGY